VFSPTNARTFCSVPIWRAALSGELFSVVAHWTGMPVTIEEIDMQNLRFINALFCGSAALLLFASPVRAADVNVTPAMQACSTDADCTITNGQCANNCSALPVNTQSVAAVEQQKIAMCGQSGASEPACKTVPALTPSCIHNRCTIGNAYRDHADAKDYGREKSLRKSALRYNAIPGTPPQDIAPAAGDRAEQIMRDLTPRGGFTAYDLPDHGASTTRSLGTIP
jgi:hypothetical protein